MDKAEFHLIRWLAWLVCFVITSSYVSLYETLTGANLFSEGLIGYGLLAAMFAFAGLWIREGFLFKNCLRSLANSEQCTEGVKK
jgi:hypothetical protein